MPTYETTLTIPIKNPKTEEEKNIKFPIFFKDGKGTFIQYHSLESRTIVKNNGQTLVIDFHERPANFETVLISTFSDPDWNQIWQREYSAAFDATVKTLTEKRDFNFHTQQPA